MNDNSKTSEFVAQHAVGKQNIYFRDRNENQQEYIPKNEWERYRDDNDTFDNINNDIINDNRMCVSSINNIYSFVEYVYDRTVEIYPNIEKIYGNHFEFEKNNYNCIKNMRLRIKLSNLNMTLSEILTQRRRVLYISFYCGYYEEHHPLEHHPHKIHTISIYTNLFFANILNKKIIEDDNYIYIPIIIFDLILAQNLELHADNINIRIDDISDPSNKYDLTLLYDNYEPNDIISPNISREYYMYQCQSGATENIEYGIPIKINHCHPCTFIIFRFDEEIELNKIKMYLNGWPPIEWCKENDEIMKTIVCGNAIYGISLIPDIKKFKDVQQSFKNSKPAGCGINFSRIDCTKLSFEYEGNEQLLVEIIFMGINILRIMNRLIGLAYAN